MIEATNKPPALEKNGRSGGMGCSCRGLTSKIHALADAKGRPVVLKITEYKAHNGRAAADILGGLDAGQILLGDRAYGSNALRTRMTTQDGWANVRPIPNGKKISAFSPFRYKLYNLVERFFSKLNISVPSPRATIRTPTISWPALNSQPRVSGCELNECAT